MTTYAKANDVEFDTPFTIHADGTIADEPSLYAPEVSCMDQARRDAARAAAQNGAWRSNAYIDVDVDSDWTPLTGFSGQDRYRGAIMHPSEYIGGGLERHLLETPGTYVVVEVREEDGSFPEGDPVGWAILRRDEEHPQDCLYCKVGEPMAHTYEPPSES